MFAYLVRRMTAAEQHDPGCHWRCQFCDSAAVARHRVEAQEAGHPVILSACERCARWFRANCQAPSNLTK